MNKIKNFFISKLRKFSPVQIIVLSFLLLILSGTILLSMPISSSGMRKITVLDALFTCVSCCCVTGVPLFDTWTNWSVFGQIVILCLIQIGALGLVSFTTEFTLIFRKKLGLRNVKIFQEGVAGDIFDVPRLIKTIFLSTMLFESIAILLLCIKFVPRYGVYGIWVSIFLCISAYCNAGFDITGFISPNESCAVFNNDFFSLTVIALLSFIGGLGFVVIIDIYNYFKNRNHNSSLSLQTKIVLKSSFFIIISGTIIFFLLEGNNTMKDFSIIKKIFISFFHSSSQRTSGFTAVRVNDQYNLTKFITMCFMLIGASPASTGGGIKTVTIVVIIYTVLNTLRGREDNIIYGKKISSATTYKAITIAVMFLSCTLLGATMIYTLDFDKNFPTIDIFYEVVSCISTTGYTSGISPILSSASKLVLISLMFFGRVGPISIIISIIENNKNQKNVVLPEEKVILS